MKVGDFSKKKWDIAVKFHLMRKSEVEDCINVGTFDAD